MFGVCSICSIRYCDMVLPREGPRTRITTRSAYLEKFIAAWPAELAAHHVHRFTFAGESFRRAAAVVHARTLEPVNARRIQPPPLHARGDHQSVAGNFITILQLDDPVRAFCSHANGLLRRENFHAKSLRLDHGAPGQIA